MLLGVLTLSLAWLVPGSEPEIAPSISKTSSPKKLRVCADPNNLPFSNERREGFENKIAEVLARDLHAELEYLWWAQRRGFVRNTLKAGDCDLVVGIATGVEMVLTTAPYYRSTYVFVSRKDRNLHIQSFDSPRLKQLKIGVQIIGDDYANTPPVHALARRGITNVHGYRVLEDYRQPNPPARIVDAVIGGEVDVAVVWGPLAGYFAAKQHIPLHLTPVAPRLDPPSPPFVYDISMGVRQKELAFKREIEGAIGRNRGEIDRILAEYHVPRVDTRGAR
jgi:mxaJ protein